MKTRLETKLTELAQEFDLREIRIQTEDRNETFIRFERGKCVGGYNTTMDEDTKAELEIECVKSIIDRRVDEGWLLGYHHEFGNGFVYRYCKGRYKGLAEQEDAA